MTRHWKFTIATTICAAILFGCWIAWRIHHFIAYGIDNAYAQWGAGNMVVNYMREHDGNWPRSWEDLRPAIEAGEGRVGGWLFDEYCSRISIDWDADPSALEAASVGSDAPPFDVIHPADGIDVKFGSMGANDIIHHYLKSKAVGTPARSSLVEPQD